MADKMADEIGIQPSCSKYAVIDIEPITGKNRKRNLSISESEFGYNDHTDTSNCETSTNKKPPCKDNQSNVICKRISDQSLSDVIEKLTKQIEHIEKKVAQSQNVMKNTKVNDELIYQPPNKIIKYDVEVISAESYNTDENSIRSTKNINTTKHVNKKIKLDKNIIFQKDVDDSERDYKSLTNEEVEMLLELPYNLDDKIIFNDKDTRIKIQDAQINEENDFNEKVSDKKKLTGLNCGKSAISITDKKISINSDSVSTPDQTDKFNKSMKHVFNKSMLDNSKIGFSTEDQRVNQSEEYHSNEIEVDDDEVLEAPAYNNSDTKSINQNDLLDLTKCENYEMMSDSVSCTSIINEGIKCKSDSVSIPEEADKFNTSMKRVLNESMLNNNKIGFSTENEIVSLSNDRSENIKNQSEGFHFNEIKLVSIEFRTRYKKMQLHGNPVFSYEVLLKAQAFEDNSDNSVTFNNQIKSSLVELCNSENKTILINELNGSDYYEEDTVEGVIKQTIEDIMVSLDSSNSFCLGIPNLSQSINDFQNLLEPVDNCMNSECLANQKKNCFLSPHESKRTVYETSKFNNNNFDTSSKSIFDEQLIELRNGCKNNFSDYDTTTYKIDSINIPDKADTLNTSIKHGFEESIWDTMKFGISTEDQSMSQSSDCSENSINQSAEFVNVGEVLLLVPEMCDDDVKDSSDPESIYQDDLLDLTNCENDEIMLNHETCPSIINRSINCTMPLDVVNSEIQTDCEETIHSSGNSIHEKDFERMIVQEEKLHDSTEHVNDQEYVCKTQNNQEKNNFEPSKNTVDDLVGVHILDVHSNVDCENNLNQIDLLDTNVYENNQTMVDNKNGTSIMNPEKNNERTLRLIVQEEEMLTKLINNDVDELGIVMDCTENDLLEVTTNISEADASKMSEGKRNFTNNDIFTMPVEVSEDVNYNLSSPNYGMGVTLSKMNPEQRNESTSKRLTVQEEEMLTKLFSNEEDELGKVTVCTDKVTTTQTCENYINEKNVIDDEASDNVNSCSLSFNCGKDVTTVDNYEVAISGRNSQSSVTGNQIISNMFYFGTENCREVSVHSCYSLDGYEMKCSRNNTTVSSSEKNESLVSLNNEIENSICYSDNKTLLGIKNKNNNYEEEIVVGIIEDIIASLDSSNTFHHGLKNLSQSINDFQNLLEPVDNCMNSECLANQKKNCFLSPHESKRTVYETSKFNNNNFDTSSKSIFDEQLIELRNGCKNNFSDYDTTTYKIDSINIPDKADTLNTSIKHGFEESIWDTMKFGISTEDQSMSQSSDCSENSINQSAEFVNVGEVLLLVPEMCDDDVKDSSDPESIYQDDLLDLTNCENDEIMLNHETCPSIINRSINCTMPLDVVNSEIQTDCEETIHSSGNSIHEKDFERMIVQEEKLHDSTEHVNDQEYVCKTQNNQEKNNFEPSKNTVDDLVGVHILDVHSNVDCENNLNQIDLLDTNVYENNQTMVDNKNGTSIMNPEKNNERTLRLIVQEEEMLTKLINNDVDELGIVMDCTENDLLEVTTNISEADASKMSEGKRNFTNDEVFIMPVEVSEDINYNGLSPNCGMGVTLSIMNPEQRNENSLKRLTVQEEEMLTKLINNDVDELGIVTDCTDNDLLEVTTNVSEADGSKMREGKRNFTNDEVFIMPVEVSEDVNYNGLSPNCSMGVTLSIKNPEQRNESSLKTLTNEEKMLSKLVNNEDDESGIVTVCTDKVTMSQTCEDCIHENVSKNIKYQNDLLEVTLHISDGNTSISSEEKRLHQADKHNTSLNHTIFNNKEIDKLTERSLSFNSTDARQILESSNDDSEHLDDSFLFKPSDRDLVKYGIECEEYEKSISLSLNNLENNVRNNEVIPKCKSPCLKFNEMSKSINNLVSSSYAKDYEDNVIDFYDCDLSSVENSDIEDNLLLSFENDSSIDDCILNEKIDKLKNTTNSTSDKETCENNSKIQNVGSPSESYNNSTNVVETPVSLIHSPSRDHQCNKIMSTSMSMKQIRINPDADDKLESFNKSDVKITTCNTIPSFNESDNINRIQSDDLCKDPGELKSNSNEDQNLGDSNENHNQNKEIKSTSEYNTHQNIEKSQSPCKDNGSESSEMSSMKNTENEEIAKINTVKSTSSDINQSEIEKKKYLDEIIKNEQLFNNFDEKLDVNKSFISPYITQSLVKSTNLKSVLAKKAAANINIRDMGDKALSTYLTQQTMTLDVLKVLHKSLDTCPSSGVLMEDPEGLVVPLMPHQKHAIAWLIWRESQEPRGGILADDMGLGKTLSMISLILKLKERPQDSLLPLEESIENRRKDVIIGGTLVVCPASLINQWETEVKTKLKPGLLKVGQYYGINRNFSAFELAENDLVITSYHVVMWDHKIRQNSSPLYKIKWYRVILDEGHNIRNHKTQTSVAVCNIKSVNRWAITGTPIHNKEADFFTLLKFVRCKPFDDWPVWKRWVGNNDDAGKRRLSLLVKTLMLRRTKTELTQFTTFDLPEKKMITIEIELSKEERNAYEKVLQFSSNLFATYLYDRAAKEKLFDPSIKVQCKVQYFQEQSQDKDEVFKDHPELLKLFKQFKNIDEIQTYHILVLLLRLRQMCCHPILIKGPITEESIKKEDNMESISEDDTDVTYNEYTDIDTSPNNIDLSDLMSCLTLEDKPVKIESVIDTNIFQKTYVSSKIKKICDLVNQKILINGDNDKAIIVSQWPSFLYLIKKNLAHYNSNIEMFSGTMPIPKRNKIIREFNNPNSGLQILLLSLKAGGVGLNLMAANHMFLIDVHWNPQLEAQACDRVYRVGQIKPVYIYKFISNNTIETRILNIQALKLQISENLFKGGTSVTSKITIDDLKQIFQFH